MLIHMRQEELGHRCNSEGVFQTQKMSIFGKDIHNHQNAIE
jgi:hypothetical protein